MQLSGETCVSKRKQKGLHFFLLFFRLFNFQWVTRKKNKNLSGSTRPAGCGKGLGRTAHKALALDAADYKHIAQDSIFKNHLLEFRPLPMPASSREGRVWKYGDAPLLKYGGIPVRAIAPGPKERCP
jgi:hypothetical protein